MILLAFCIRIVRSRVSANGTSCPATNITGETPCIANRNPAGCSRPPRRSPCRSSQRASSHREAPFITEHAQGRRHRLLHVPQLRAAGRAGYVTLIANYLPLQDAYGGPNYFTLDPNALYEIHVDNNGDGKEDLTFQFRFKNTCQDITLHDVGGKDVAIPL